jgi:hypothetical protein
MILVGCLAQPVALSRSALLLRHLSPAPLSPCEAQGISFENAFLLEYVKSVMREREYLFHYFVRQEVNSE